MPNATVLTISSLREQALWVCRILAEVYDGKTDVPLDTLARTLYRKGVSDDHIEQLVGDLRELSTQIHHVPERVWTAARPASDVAGDASTRHIVIQPSVTTTVNATDDTKKVFEFETISSAQAQQELSVLRRKRRGRSSPFEPVFARVDKLEEGQTIRMTLTKAQSNNLGQQLRKRYGKTLSTSTAASRDGSDLQVVFISLAPGE